MKKLMITTYILGLVLVLQSFTNYRTENSGDYNEVNNEEIIAYIADVGSFTTAEKSHYDGDKGVWQYRYKEWTFNFAEASILDVETIILRN